MSENKPYEENLNEEEEIIQTIELELEDGTIEECEILDILEVDGKSYIALLPMEGNEYYVYECKATDEENCEIINIEDDAVHEKVIKAFEEYYSEEYDDEDYDDDDDDDDEEDDDDYDDDEDYEDDEDDEDVDEDDEEEE